jgi:ferrous iron transport protein B
MTTVSETALLRVALVGAPNCGKTALFNALTGSRQKVANYAGVTVERKSGRARGFSGRAIEILDLPGSYSLRGRSPDERVTRDIVLGNRAGEAAPDVILCVVDATNLALHLRLVLELKQLGKPMVLALNMMDLAKRNGTEIDVAALSAALNIPVIPTVAVRGQGLCDVLAAAEHQAGTVAVVPSAWAEPSAADVRALQRAVKEILKKAVLKEGLQDVLTRKLDRVLLHPVFGIIILLGILFFMFQAVFSWAAAPMDAIDGGFTALGDLVKTYVSYPLLQSFLADGLIAGVGSVLVFLPQIMILFFFILLLEDFGYMARAAFLMDRLMGAVGLHGRAFIPLLSSFACAIPGIMAARTIDNRRDRLLTIMIAPLMTCSARIPVYTLVIAAFIPDRSVHGFNLQGLVMFGLYAAGIVSALLVAAILKLTVFRGPAQPLILELPTYKIPSAKNILRGVLERGWIFLRRAGTVILTLMIVVWAMASFPLPPEGAMDPAIHYSFAGMIGLMIQPLLAPIGFNWQIAIALIPGMAAREVAVAVLGTVYALSGDKDAVAQSLTTLLSQSWTLPTALSFLAWYVFAPQCLSTLAVVRRETNSRLWPTVMFLYMFALAYGAAWATYRIALSF